MSVFKIRLNSWFIYIGPILAILTGLRTSYAKWEDLPDHRAGSIKLQEAFHHRQVRSAGSFIYYSSDPDQASAEMRETTSAYVLEQLDRFFEFHPKSEDIQNLIELHGDISTLPGARLALLVARQFIQRAESGVLQGRYSAGFICSLLSPSQDPRRFHRPQNQTALQYRIYQEGVTSLYEEFLYRISLAYDSKNLIELEEWVRPHLLGKHHEFLSSTQRANWVESTVRRRALVYQELLVLIQRKQKEEGLFSRIQSGMRNALESSSNLGNRFVNIFSTSRRIKHNRINAVAALKIRVRNDFLRLRPDLNGTIKYFLVRDLGPQESSPQLNGSPTSETQRTCSICTTPVDPNRVALPCAFSHPQSNESNTIGACAEGHCLATYIRNEMEANRYPIRCLDQFHKHELPLTRELLTGLGFSKEEILNLEYFTLLEYNRALNPGLPISQICPFPGCQIVNFEDQSHPVDHHIRCQGCERTYCYRCAERQIIHNHKPERCPDLLAAANATNNRPTTDEDNWMNPNNPRLRPCPYCLEPFSKGRGCNHVKCKKCGANFHYHKGKLRYTSRTKQEIQHYSDFNIGADLPESDPTPEEVPPRLYRVPGESDYRVELESTFQDLGPVLTLEEARF